MKTLAAAMLVILLLLSNVQAQNGRSSWQITPGYIDRDEVKQLIEILKSTPETRISFENFDGTPLTITEAMVKIVKRQQSGKSIPATTQDEYVMEERVTLINNTDNRTRLVILQFTNAEGQKEIELGDWATIEPYGSYVFGERRKAEIEYKSLPVDPSKFTVKVLEVRFEDGIIWEMYPSQVEESNVDTKPKPLSKPQPTYTEEARRNRIRGAVRMHLLVGSDGEVKQVRIIRSLPDGLNEEAVKEAYNLKFKPAMKDGQPVQCWLLFEIEFDPRQKTN
jgi:TonB family protein